jgi:hypothetical protein
MVSFSNCSGAEIQICRSRIDMHVVLTLIFFKKQKFTKLKHGTEQLERYMGALTRHSNMM